MTSIMKVLKVLDRLFKPQALYKAGLGLALVTTFVSSPAWSDYPIGTNLAGISSWGSQRPFNDLFKQSRPWFTQCSNQRDRDCANTWDTREADKLNLDEHGWVVSLPEPSVPGFSIASTLLDLPAGEYYVSYEGAGEIGYGLDARLLKRDKKTGIDSIRVSKAPGRLLLQILETDPEKTGDYIKNIRVTTSLPEEDANPSIFNSTFLDQIRPYSTVRFMDWMATNGSEIAHWEDRRAPEHATYSQEGVRQGVPIEIMVELANELDKSPWFTLPHQVDDEYVHSFAALVLANIETSKTIYIEYSNEAWNQAFPQYRWMASRAKTLWPNTTIAETSQVANWYGKRTAEICTIWKDVFGDRANQISCVMGSQAANVWIGEQALTCPLWDNNPKSNCVNHGIDAFAIAPYFGGYLGRREKEKVLSWIKLDDPLDALFEEIDKTALPMSQNWIEDNKALADKYGVNLLAYEAGQHLVGTGGFENNEEVTALFIDANRDDRMRTAYLKYYKSWFNNDGGLAMSFTLIEEPSKWGSWGVLETQDQKSSPKHDALMIFLSQNSDVE